MSDLLSGSAGTGFYCSWVSDGCRMNAGCMLDVGQIDVKWPPTAGQCGNECWCAMSALHRARAMRIPIHMPTPKPMPIYIVLELG